MGLYAQGPGQEVRKQKAGLRRKGRDSLFPHYGEGGLYCTGAREGNEFSGGIVCLGETQGSLSLRKMGR